MKIVLGPTEIEQAIREYVINSGFVTVNDPTKLSVAWVEGEIEFESKQTGEVEVFLK